MDLARTHRWSLTNKTGAKVFKKNRRRESGSIARRVHFLIGSTGYFWFPHFWFLGLTFLVSGFWFLFFTLSISGFYCGKNLGDEI